MIQKYSEIYWAVCKPCGSDWEDRRYIVDQNAHTYEWTGHENTVLPSKTRLFIWLALKPVAQSGSFNECPWETCSKIFPDLFGNETTVPLGIKSLVQRFSCLFFPANEYHVHHWRDNTSYLPPMSRLSKHPWGLRQSESQIMNVLFIEQIQKWEPNKHGISVVWDTQLHEKRKIKPSARVIIISMIFLHLQNSCRLIFNCWGRAKFLPIAFRQTSRNNYP